MDWNETFLTLFTRCVATYRAGDKNFETYYRAEDLGFLAEIGCKPREFFDFVEDFCEEGEPTASTALLVAAVRRDYFLTIQKGAPSERMLTRDELPGFGETLDDLPYFPRILAKGRAKLRGALDPDIMFGCGGDRNFLKKNGNLHPADFLRQLWAAGDDDSRMVSWLRQAR
jgi:hypothetical protein